ncbi:MULTISPECIES: Ku protein [Protofrankia]|uniref:Non-homologous end joining protein Ku n=1 Tax=Candidatus Protofrankia datiscae TaxID=2716812 RepID=F8AX61_9ACTN|nr:MULTISPECIES: Ku protein [Protofrankia]AEH08410.1 DNA repair protein [Candidatus Protofrankia datiscae]
MRSIWKGAISFGLVRIPVRLYPATEDRDVSFHQVRRWDGSRIRYKRVAAADGVEVPYSEVAKGYELPSGETVVLTDDDFANLPLPTSHTIDVLEFVPLAQVDPIYYARSYYIEPDRGGVRSYVLLRDALGRSGRVALVKIALRQREQLATLRIRGDVLVLSTMVWPDEVRRPDFPFLDEEVNVGPQELVMAQTLIESLSDDFDPTPYTDGYRQALQAVIDAKVSGSDVVTPPVEGETATSADDLVAVLAASVAQAHRDRQPTGAGRGTGPAAPAARPAVSGTDGGATDGVGTDGAGVDGAAGNGNGNGRQGARNGKRAGGPRAGAAGRR